MSEPSGGPQAGNMGVGLEVAKDLEPTPPFAPGLRISRAYMACPVGTSIERISNRCRTPSTSVIAKGGMAVLSKSTPNSSAVSSLKQL